MNGFCWRSPYSRSMASPKRRSIGGTCSAIYASISPSARLFCWGSLLAALAHAPLVISVGWAIGLVGVVVAMLTFLPFAVLFERGGDSIWPSAVVHFSRLHHSTWRTRPRAAAGAGVLDGRSGSRVLRRRRAGSGRPARQRSHIVMCHLVSRVRFCDRRYGATFHRAARGQASNGSTLIRLPLSCVSLVPRTPSSSPRVLTIAIPVNWSGLG